MMKMELKQEFLCRRASTANQRGEAEGRPPLVDLEKRARYNRFFRAKMCEFRARHINQNHSGSQV